MRLVEDCLGGVAPLYPSPTSPTPAGPATSSAINYSSQSSEVAPPSPLAPRPDYVPAPRPSIMSLPAAADRTFVESGESAAAGIAVIPPSAAAAFFPLSPAFFHPAALLLDLQRYNSGVAEAAALEQTSGLPQGGQSSMADNSPEIDTVEITTKVADSDFVIRMIYRHVLVCIIFDSLSDYFNLPSDKV